MRASSKALKGMLMIEQMIREILIFIKDLKFIAESREENSQEDKSKESPLQELLLESQTF